MSVNPDSDPNGYLFPLDKGVPDDITAFPIRDVPQRGWNVLREDLPLPVATINAVALEHNSRWMREFIASHDVALAPHGKTSMAPALFDLQIRDGAWGITLSTPHQVSVALSTGYRRILVANQIVGRAGVSQMFRAIADHPDLDLYCLIDSTALVEHMEAIATDMGATRRLKVLVEKGFDNGRTGSRTVQGAVAVARSVNASRHLQLAGIEGFEGILRRENPEQTLLAINDFLASIVEVAEACDREGLFSGPILLSAGGSAYFDLVVEVFRKAHLTVDTTIMLRSGCYITHDSGLYVTAFNQIRQRAPDLLRGGGLQSALSVWGYVQSVPEPTRAIVGIGTRDVGGDRMPVPEAWFRPRSGMTGPEPMPSGHTVIALNDQHGFMTVPIDTPLAVGDMIAFGVSHPCLTFDKWRVLHVIDEAHNVISSVRTYF